MQQVAHEHRWTDKEDSDVQNVDEDDNEGKTVERHDGQVDKKQSEAHTSRLYLNLW